MGDKLLLENQLCFRVYAFSRLVIQTYEEHLGPLGLTYPQYLVLLILWEEDAQPVNDIASRLMLKTNTISPVLKRMEAMRLLTRQRDHIDSRRVIVRLSDEGRALRAKAIHIPEAIGSVILENVPNSDIAEQFKPLLDQLIDGLTQRELRGDVATSKVVSAGN